MPEGQGTKRNSLDHASEKVAVMLFGLRVPETVGKVSQIGEHLLCLKGPLSSASLSPAMWTLGPPFSWSGTRYLFLISSWQWGCVIPWERTLTRCFPASHSVPRAFSTCFTCMHAQSCPTLCDLMNYSPPGSSVHGILQARILEWGTISFFRGSSSPRDWTHVSCIGRWILYHWVTWEALSGLIRHQIPHATWEMFFAKVIIESNSPCIFPR